MYSFPFFIFGSAIGSFINCLVYRINNGVSFWKGRSFCPKCKKKIAWHDNIPLLSFIFLRGHCRQCHSPISWQYPLVELACAILTVIIFNFTLPAGRQEFTIYNLLITYCLLAIFVSDLVYMTIPDEVVVFAGFIAILRLFVTYYVLRITFLPYLFSALGAGLFFYVLYLVTKGKGMGFGDVKLASLMGIILGWPKIMIALYLAFISGAVVGVILILVKRKKFGQVIAFGPYLALWTWITMLFGDRIWSGFSLLMRW